MSKDKKKLKLGNTVKDVISGMTGIATSKIKYLTGCVQYGISPKLKEGEVTPPDTHYFDKLRVEFVDEGIAKRVEEKAKEVEKEPGGAVISSKSLKGIH